MTFLDHIRSTVAELGGSYHPPFEVDGQVVGDPEGYEAPTQVVPSINPRPPYVLGQIVLSEDAKLLLAGAFFLLALAIIMRR